MVRGRMRTTVSVLAATGVSVALLVAAAHTSLLQASVPGRAPASAALGPAPTRFAVVSAGADYSCAVTAAGALWCWGANGDGQLGDGTRTDHSSPVRVGVPGGVVTAVSAGAYHTCATDPAGVLWCWGANGDGQLGTGDRVDRLRPARVAAVPARVVSAVARTWHTCAVLATSRVLCWGRNSVGQLGTGDTRDRLLPTAVDTTEGFQSVTGGADHTCALTVGGQVRCWGWNLWGQVGDGTTTDRASPTPTVGLAGRVVALASRSWHTCALTETGRLYCWGFNQFGELGDDSTANAARPVTVVAAPPATQVSVGIDHTCALSRPGVAYCWGRNNTGQLGEGTTRERPTPVRASQLGADLMTLSAGGYHTCATDRVGALTCVGWDAFDQLGPSAGTAPDRAGRDLGP